MGQKIVIGRHELGSEGEELVANWFRSRGLTVERSTDTFDGEKDLTINGKSVEVKTQTIYRRFPYLQDFSPAFTVPILEDTKISRNQLNKCLNVDHLIFVSRSSMDDPNVRIFRAPELGKRHFTISRNSRDGRYVAGFMLEHMKQMTIFSDDDIVEKFRDNWKSMQLHYSQYKYYYIMDEVKNGDSQNSLHWCR